MQSNLSKKICVNEADIWVYGRGGTGIRTAWLLITNKCKFSGFIDKGAHENSDVINGKTVLKPYLANHRIHGRDLIFNHEEGVVVDVLTLGEAEEKITNKENTLIIICVKDVFSHNGIANSMIKKGFHYIIYKPMCVLKDTPYGLVTKEVNYLYDEIVDRAKLPDKKVSVSYTRQTEYHFKNKLLIKSTSECIISWVPIELIYNYKDALDYPGFNMPLMFGLVGLYRAFLGVYKDDDYVEAMNNFILYCGEWLHYHNFALDEARKNSFIESRSGVFQSMQRMGEVEISFFERNAPEVEYQDGKFYLISSGRNRIAFLIAKGYKYVPLKIRPQDYAEWCDLRRVKDIEKSISKGMTEECFAPEPNPFLADRVCEFCDYMKLFVIPAAFYIVKMVVLSCVDVDLNGVKHIDFLKYEKKKRNIIIYQNMKDGGMLKKYFESNGFKVLDYNDAVSRREHKDKDYVFLHGIKPDGLDNVTWFLLTTKDTAGLWEVKGFKMFDSIGLHGELSAYSSVRL